MTSKAFYLLKLNTNIFIQQSSINMYEILRNYSKISQITLLTWKRCWCLFMDSSNEMWYAHDTHKPYHSMKWLWKLLQLDEKIWLLITRKLYLSLPKLTHTARVSKEMWKKKINSSGFIITKNSILWNENIQKLSTTSYIF